MNFLGSLVWYTIPEESRIHHKEFVGRMLEASDMMVTMPLPAIPRNVDVFKRACRDAEIQTNISGFSSKVRIFTEHSGGNATNIERGIFLAIKSGSEEEKKSVGKVVYNKDNDKITFTTGYKGNQEAVDILAARVREQFEAEKDTMSAYAMRAFIRQVLVYEFNATQIKKNVGMYFVEEEHQDELRALAQVIEPLGDFNVVPLVNRDDMKKLIASSISSDCMSRLVDIEKNLEFVEGQKNVTLGKLQTIQDEIGVVKALTRSDYFHDDDVIDRLLMVNERHFDLYSKALA